MRRIIRRFFGWQIGIALLSAPAAQAQNLLPFDSIPQWIEEHMNFPQEDADYGTEQFCISAAWDGRVFLTARPYTLDPACERAIVEAVESAPRCEFTGRELGDIYKYIRIDFARHVGRTSAGLHSVPVFSKKSSGPFNGRYDFAGWAESEYKIPKELRAQDYADTLTVRYRIGCDGGIADLRLSDCANPEVAASLRELLLSSPRWTPAYAENGMPVDITLEDRWIVRFENRRPRIAVFVDAVYRNDAPAPDDPSIVVMNPEIAATCRDGNFHKMLFEQLPKADTVAVRCRFVVEADGSTSGIEVESTSGEIAERVAAFVGRTNWQPATQQGSPVRSLRTYAVRKRPAAYGDSEADFGRDYLYLQTPPHAKNRKYLQSDGSYAVYPFDDQGRFNGSEYQSQQIRAAKESSAKGRRDYSRRLKKRYVDN